MTPEQRRQLSSSFTSFTAVVALTVLVAAGPILAQPPGARGAARVELVHADAGWQLLRGGKPYFVKGAGGDGPKELLAQAGGNSVRTWGADNLGKELDDASAQGLTVAAGIWLGHERHGFDYSNADQVAQQREQVREIVLKHKDHPALLLWALGNEMEGSGDNAAVWSAVDSLAALVKDLDPDHPTMTVIAEVGGNKVRNFERLCPHLDLLGINSYAGASSLPQRYKEAGGTKPYLLTEFGPPGQWEVGKTAWGAPEEPTSTQKGELYREHYENAVASQPGACLGSYAFLWGSKQEATATWFGMLLPDGSKTAAVDTMTELWSSKPPANRCPQLANLKLAGPEQADPGETVRATVQATDPENDPLKVHWVLRRESGQYETGGDPQAATALLPEAIVHATDAEAEVKLPKDGGSYRLYVYAYDGKGGAAVANVPLRVNGPEPRLQATKAALPLILFGEGAQTPAPYVPTGWMGNTGALAMDEKCTENVDAGRTCAKIEYRATDGWGGIVWQDPPNDWGSLAGGHDLTGATKVTFRARGATGGEKAKFGFGILGRDAKFGDTAKAEVVEQLGVEWRQFTLDLTGKDLTRIKTGFMCVLEGTGRPLTLYLDDIRYE
ncbi:MAG: hypothetical protein AUJ96_16350 [Armatimonadetes bacterium CG2_30_66_41]|nr:hypothetical protein [Armatimonadota bacterium]OIP02399.1 MAG: hypothetical protein AUJ96_16350 [Armatimonadetes bacterium CG2_30_66_41]PJB60690.1 MAG: hypothetical protein CO096_32665 [Armatimonadetes bacterium CG_4_9_14_3_um_filter_66_14]